LYFSWETQPAERNRPTAVRERRDTSLRAMLSLHAWQSVLEMSLKPPDGGSVCRTVCEFQEQWAEKFKFSEGDCREGFDCERPQASYNAYGSLVVAGRRGSSRVVAGASRRADLRVRLQIM